MSQITDNMYRGIGLHLTCRMSAFPPVTLTVQTFLLKVTKQNADGTVTLIKTVPCDEFGIYTCLVEVSPSSSLRYDITSRRVQ